MKSIVVITCFLLIVQGDCMEFLLQSKPHGIYVLEDYPDFYFNWSLQNDIFDYHFSQRKIYYVKDQKLFRRRLVDRNPVEVAHIVDNNLTSSEVRDFVVDWVHDTFYVVNDNIMVGPLNVFNDDIQLENVINKDKITSVTQEPSTIRRIVLDPYTGSLFVLANYDQKGHNRTGQIYIVVSSLKGEKLNIIITETFSIENVTFGLDVGERKLHIVYMDYLYTYNYEGVMLLKYQIKSGISAAGLAALENKIYLGSLYRNIYENLVLNITVINQSNVLHEETLTKPLARSYNNTVKNILKLILVDTRTQRRKENNMYVCERQDCPKFCYVTDNEEICTSYNVNSKVNDGFSCRDIFCSDLLLFGENMACTFHFDRQNIVKHCSQTDNLRSTVMDYHHTQGYMYYIDRVNNFNQLRRLAFNFSLDAPNTRSFEIDFDAVLDMKDIAIDWVENTIYGISPFGLIFVSHLNQDRFEFKIYGKIFDIFNVSYELLKLAESFQLDPYQKVIFGKLSPVHIDKPMGKYIFFRFDIVNKNVSFFESMRLIKNSTFYVNVNEMKIYVLNNHNLSIYNYDGKLLETRDIGMTADYFSVFMDVMYVTVIGSPEITKIPLYEINLQHESYEKLTHHMNKNSKIYVKVLDARVQRRMKNGTFLCDRKDCAYECEVRPSGDTCVCPKTKAKTIDGTTCYECGQSSLTSMAVEPQIVSGSISYPGQFPWHAVLYNTKTWEAFCGGTLISSRLVLTAAHCVTLPSEKRQPTPMDTNGLIVALGKIRRSWDSPEERAIKLNVTEILAFDKYAGTSVRYANDIALLLLSSRVSIDHNVMPACLDFNLNQLPPHETLDGYVPGFGKTEDCHGDCSKPSELLKYTNSSVISFNECFRAINKLDESTFHQLTPDKFCVGNGTVSTVQKGDSGGGLTLVYNGLHYVTGIVSVKLAKLHGGHFKYSFGAFTNISEHMNWIKNHMSEKE